MNPRMASSLFSPAGVGRLVRLSLLSAGLVVGVAAVPAWAQAPAPLVRGLPDFTELVDVVGPSVVNIRTMERTKVSQGNGAGPDEQMLEFFRRFGIPVPPGSPAPSPRRCA